MATPGIADRWTPRLWRGMVACLAALACAGCSAAPVEISRSGAGAYEASFAPFGHGFAVAWYDTRDGNAEIYMRLVDASGRPAQPERRLTSDPASSYEPDIIAAGSDVVVAWYERSGKGALTPRLGRWSRAGERRWTVALAAAGRNPIVRLAGDRLFVAWIVDGAGDHSALWSGWWDLSGLPLGEPWIIGDAGRTTWNLNGAVGADGQPWVVLDAKAGTRSEELFLVRPDATARRVVQLTPDDGVASKYPDLAINGTQAALAWYDVRDGNEDVYVASLGNAGAGIQLVNARRVTTTPGESTGAYLAWNGDRVGLVWSDEVEGQHEIFFQGFDVSGAPLGEARRLTRTGDRSLVPTIHPWGRTFALAWTEYRPGAEPGHDAQARSEVAFTLVPP